MEEKKRFSKNHQKPNIWLINKFDLSPSPTSSLSKFKPSFWLFSAETGSSESQTALLDPSPSSLQLPSSTSWSGQPHSAEEEEKAGWKGVEQALYTVRNVKVSREAAGSNLWCTVSLRGPKKSPTGIHHKNTQKMQTKHTAYRAVERCACVWGKALFVESHKVLSVLCPSWDDMRQPSICHKNFILFIFLCPAAEQKACVNLRGGTKTHCVVKSLTQMFQDCAWNNLLGLHCLAETLRKLQKA